MGNSTCPAINRAPVDPIPFYFGGNLNFKAHDVGWIVCSFFSCIATVASAWLVWKHLTYYTCPQQQRNIIRMLFMVPIYSIITTLSYIFFNESIYYTTVCDCYEAVVITSFFNLLLQYVGDTPAEQLEVFRQVKLEKWFFPLNFWTYRPEGVHFLWLMKICILQYAVLQPICTLAAVGLQYYGLYCLESWEPYFGHIWITIIVAISISVAMYCIIQIYLPITEEVKPYKPVLKFLAVKSIIFLTFWQNSFLSVLIYFNVIKKTKYFTAGDIQIGINALLVTFEMMVFGFVHIKAFTYVIYRPQDKLRMTKRGRALLDVLDFRDWYYDMKNTTRYVAARGRGKDFTIADDIRNQKHLHLEKALGRDRLLHLNAERENDKQSMPTFWKDGMSGTGEIENEMLIGALDLEKTAGCGVREASERLPKDYNPEDDGEQLESDSLNENVKKSSLFSLPALPFVSYNSHTGAIDQSSSDPKQSNCYHHLNNEEEEDDEQAMNDIFIARKGVKSCKEASLGLGYWWRAFRERVSGGSMDENGEFRGDGYDEKTDMLAEELRRSIDGEEDNDEIKLSRPPLRRDTASSDVSMSVLQGKDSPLSLIISEHGGKENKGRNSATLPRIGKNEGQVAMICDTSQMVARQGSTRAALEGKDAFAHRQALPAAFERIPPSQQIVQIEAKRTLSRESARVMSQVKSVEPSLSGGAPSVSTASAANISKNKFINTNALHQIAPSTKPALRSSGPKGKNFSLVLPPRLSKRDEALEPATQQYVPNQVSSSIPPANHIIPSVSSRVSKIKFVDIQATPRKDIGDDPEAEPVNRTGTVVAGAQSLSQINARKRQQGEEEKRQKAVDLERSRQQQRQVGQQRETSDGTFQMFSKKTVATQPYTTLPAPSQMAQTDKRRQDVFAPVNFGSSSRFNGAPPAVIDDRARPIRQRTSGMRTNVDGQSLEVGSFISRQGILDLTTRPTQYPHRYEDRRINYPRNSLPTGPMPLPFYQRRQPQNDQRPVLRSTRHSTGSTLPPNEVALYDRFTGEPTWQPQQQDRQSRVESRRRNYEAPPGFHFDYID